MYANVLTFAYIMSSNHNNLTVLSVINPHFIHRETEEPKNLINIIYLIGDIAAIYNLSPKPSI